MKKKLLLPLCLLAALVTGCGGPATSTVDSNTTEPSTDGENSDTTTPVGPTQLDAPVLTVSFQKVSMDTYDALLVWNEIADADSYELCYFATAEALANEEAESLEVLEGLSKTLLHLEWKDEIHAIFVLALGDGTEYADSAASNVLVLEDELDAWMAENYISTWGADLVASMEGYFGEIAPVAPLSPQFDYIDDAESEMLFIFDEEIGDVTAEYAAILLAEGFTFLFSEDQGGYDLAYYGRFSVLTEEASLVIGVGYYPGDVPATEICIFLDSSILLACYRTIFGNFTETVDGFAVFTFTEDGMYVAYDHDNYPTATDLGYMHYHGAIYQYTLDENGDVVVGSKVNNSDGYSVTEYIFYIMADFLPYLGYFTFFEDAVNGNYYGLSINSLPSNARTSFRNMLCSLMHLNSSAATALTTAFITVYPDYSLGLEAYYTSGGTTYTTGENLYTNIGTTVNETLAAFLAG